jgi:Domain of unknown function (DUF4082)/Viral BACON domain
MSMSDVNSSESLPVSPLAKEAPRKISLYLRLTWLSLIISVFMITRGQSSAQTTLSLFGNGTPRIVDSGGTQPLVLGVKVFSDVPGQILGCSFYKAAANTGVHVVTLWDSSGKVLATQTAGSETPSGKQSVMFPFPVSIAANQTVTCGYYSPNGHFSYDTGAFAVQKNVPPLHVPINGGVYVYGTQATAWPTGTWSASSYWADVLFAPLTGSSSASSTWISSAKLSAAGNTAAITWNTAVPSDSQVEYGSTTAYGSVTALDAAKVTSHAVVIGGLAGGSTYHFRVRSRDSDAVLAVGLDYSLTTAAPVTVSTSPLTATLVSGAKQQFTATVGNTSNSAVTWSATAGAISSSGLFTAQTVLTATPVTVTATSQADSNVNSSAYLTVNPVAPVLAVNPTSLSFAAQVGASSPTPASVNITNTGGGSLNYTGASDQPWLMLSGASGTAPSVIGVTPSITGLKAGSYTGHVTLTGGGTMKSVTVALTVTAPPVQPTVALSWKASVGPNVVSYSMYRSNIAGSSYALLASAIGGLNYIDQTVQSGAKYYYVVTAVDDQGRESGYSNQMVLTVP